MSYYSFSILSTFISKQSRRYAAGMKNLYSVTFSAHRSTSDTYIRSNGSDKESDFSSSEEMNEFDVTMTKLKNDHPFQKYILMPQFFKASQKVSGNKRGITLAKQYLLQGNVLRLGQKIYLYPDVIEREISELIDSQGMKFTKFYAQIQKEFEQLDKAKKHYDSIAQKYIKRLSILCGLYLLLQPLVLCILTFRVLSWDIMEPFCFYAKALVTTALLIFTIVSKKCSTSNNLLDHLRKKHEKKIYASAAFDIARYKKLKEAISTH